MAGFNTHLTSGVAAGTFFSAAGWAIGILTLTQTGAIFILAAVAALLPDLDSDTGKPLLFLSQVISVLVPSSLVADSGESRFFARSDHLLFHPRLPGRLPWGVRPDPAPDHPPGDDAQPAFLFDLRRAGLSSFSILPAGWRRPGPPWPSAAAACFT